MAGWPGGKLNPVGFDEANWRGHCGFRQVLGNSDNYLALKFLCFTPLLHFISLADIALHKIH
jgi:hypothetical protein